MIWAIACTCMRHHGEPSEWALECLIPPAPNDRWRRFRRIIYFRHSLLTVLMKPTCNGALNERRPSLSMEKLFAHMSDAVPHKTIVRRRRESKPLDLLVPSTNVLATECWVRSISTSLFALKHLACTTHRAAEGQ